CSWTYWVVYSMRRIIQNICHFQCGWFSFTFVLDRLVRSCRYELRPLPSDYLQPRVNQLRVELFQGSVTQKDSRLRGFDLVTSIELIEHLTLDDVERFSSSLFGYMSPQVAIVSTPNSEYNPLLPGLAGFRHKDHKFEWTRAEFRSWALKVCCDYGYEVEFTGVGRAPPGQQDQVGFCSQIAVFRRLREGDRCNVWPGNDAEDLPYTKVTVIIYPSLRDSNHLRGFLLCELFSCAKTLMTGSSVQNVVPFIPRKAEGVVQTGENNFQPGSDKLRV
uniref:Small RNA 2'-O-methyltransferase n=1 Tax=Salarias fasciatus TaxID=181472 RepID=A0A672FFV9_SALFA